MSKKYVVRYADGRESEALNLDEVKHLIYQGKISEDTSIAIQPGNEFVPVRTLSELKPDFTDESEPTLVMDAGRITAGAAEEEKTKLYSTPDTQVQIQSEQKKIEPVPETEDWVDDDVKKQETKIFTPPKSQQSKDFQIKEKRKFGIPKKSVLVLIVLAILAYEIAFESDESARPKSSQIVLRPVRPRLPSGGTGKVDPEASTKIYTNVMQFYMEDTVQGYRKAVQGFQLALQADPQNVKALAMLASSYINLIDSSNKDENTYSVINKLIELSKSKDVNLVETLIAEIEFLSITRRYDAAIQRLTEHNNVTGKLDPVLYYYLGWLYYLKREYVSAMKYLNQIPASALPMAKLYFLRGLLHEENKAYDEAKGEYARALKLNPQHARSILGLVRISEQQRDLKNMGRYIEFLTTQPSLQSPPEFVQALIFKAKFALFKKRPDVAVETLEEALQIEPRNADLRLEYYTLLSGEDQNSPYKNLAKMYALVLQGEKQMKEQNFHEASAIFLQARETFPKSDVPLEKMGDLFFQEGQYEKSRQNYEKALEKNPKSIEVATKLIDALIKNHDYVDAQKYIAKYRNHPKLKSSIDRLAGDLAFQQGYYPQAVQFYKKAMARDTIDTEVYSSYANALMELDQCKDAQFFYMLAQRLDPFNYAAIIGSAKCLLKTDNIDIAVSRVQDDLARLLKARADLLSGIAELYFLANEYEKSLQFIEQAKNVDPTFPDPYKIEGEIYLRLQNGKKDNQKKALDSFKAYSDRKVSDPYGYVRRFEIFLAASNFEQANAELDRIFELSPRFPELHYRRAQLLAKMGRTKEAIAELDEELKLNPRLVKAMIELGGLYTRLNSFDEAMKYYVQAMEIDPQNAQAKIGAGYINYLKRQFASAVALYQAALTLDKGNPEIHKKLGLAYRDSGDLQKAAQSFKNYLDLAPDAPDRNEFEKYR